MSKNAYFWIVLFFIGFLTWTLLDGYYPGSQQWKEQHEKYRFDRARPA